MLVGERPIVSLGGLGGLCALGVAGPLKSSCFMIRDSSMPASKPNLKTLIVQASADGTENAAVWEAGSQWQNPAESRDCVRFPASIPRPLRLQTVFEI